MNGLGPESRQDLVRRFMVLGSSTRRIVAGFSPKVVRGEPRTTPDLITVSTILFFIQFHLPLNVLYTLPTRGGVWLII